MEQRTFSPVVLVGGLVAAALVGFVAAKQLGGPDTTTPPVAPIAAEAPLAPGGEGAPEAIDGTEALIEPLAAATEAPSGAPASTAAPIAPPRTTPRAEPTPERRAAPARTATRPTRPAASTPAARPASRPALPPASPSARPVDDRDDRAVDVAQAEPTWSRPFPAPESTGSLPSRTPPRIDAPPPPPVVRTVTLPADAVVGLQIERTVSSADAEIEDEVTARVTRDVRADGLVVIPAGTRVTGSVTLVDEGGKVRERARLGIRFHTVVLADGTEVRLPTETIYRDGESPSRRSAAKIGGGATAGAVIGAILGGGKGAAIGAAIGAGGGTAATMAGDRRPATLPAGQTLTVRLSDPVAIDVPR